MLFVSFFFFNDTATTEIYTLSLHDALPIYADAGSTTTASSLRPSTPPFLFCSSISISMTSFRVVSLIAIVPDRECSTPTLIGAPCAKALPAAPANRPAATMPVLRIDPNFIPLSFLSTEYPRQLPQERKPCQTLARAGHNF